VTAAATSEQAVAGERFAVYCRSLDGPDSLQYRATTRERLAPDSVRLSISACGVNFPDLLLTRGKYQLRPELPFTPGMEACGTVTAVGSGVTGFALGDRVTATARMGLYATEAVVPAVDVRPAPASFTAAEAATYLVAVHTARHALVDRARLRAGESVLVLGAGGGLGLAAVELAALLGARVLAASSSADKLEAARGRGAEVLLDYLSADLVEQVRAAAPDGVDVVFDPVGGEMFERCTKLMAWNGRLLVVGFASGEIGVARSNLALIRGYSIIGVRAGEAMRRDPELGIRSALEISRWVEAGHLRPLISATYALSDAARALHALERRDAVGRIALLTRETQQP